MILTPHILVGAAIGSKLSSYPLILVVSIVIHFLMDVIPHYDYDISLFKNKETKYGKKTILSALKVFIDFSLAAAFVVLITYNKAFQATAIFGLFTALIPDGLLFLHGLFPKQKFLAALAKFHRDDCHWFKKITRPNFLGLVTQITIAILAIIVLTAL